MVYGAKTLGSAAGRVFTGGKWKGAERLQQSADRALEVAKRNNSVLEHQLKRHADVYGFEDNAFDVAPGKFLRPGRLARRFGLDMDAFRIKGDMKPFVQRSWA